MLEMFESPKLAEELMFKEFHLIDLQSSSVDRLSKDEKASVAEILLKQGIMRDFCKFMETYYETLKSIMPQSSYLQRAVYYIFLVERHNRKKLVNLLKEVTNNEDLVMNVAQQFKAEGRLEGIQQGKLEGILQTAKNMLKYGVSLDLIKKTTGLSKIEIEKLTKDK